MTNPEAQPPLGGEFADISELGAETTDLIYRFRTALVELPEFQRAVADAYLIASDNVPRWVTFERGGKSYSAQYSFTNRESNFSDTEDFEIEASEKDSQEKEKLFLVTISKSKLIQTSFGYVDERVYRTVNLHHSVFLDEDELSENLNNRTALTKGKRILEELKNPQRDTTPEVLPEGSDKTL